MKLRELATARSGDKGSDANIGVIAKNQEAYLLLKESLTEEKVAAFFKPLRPKRVVRYEIESLGAFNFVLFGVLAPGGTLSLRCDAQGKALGQALMEMDIDVYS